MAMPKPPSKDSLEKDRHIGEDEYDEADEDVALQYQQRYIQPEYVNASWLGKFTYLTKYYIYDLITFRSSHDHPHRYNSERASILWGIPTTNPVRYYFMKLADSMLFKHLFILIVLIYSIFLVASGAEGVGRSPGYYEADIFFTSLFTFEMLILIAADGLAFAGVHSYLASAWNWIDLFCTIMGWLKFYFGENYVGILRTFRLIGPLSNIPILSSLGVLLKCLILSVAQLFEIAVVIFFFLIVFAAIGMILYSTDFNHRCQNQLTGVWEQTLYSFRTSALCTTSANGRMCDTAANWLCVNSGTSPWYGAMNFDNILTSLLSVFIIISNDGWTTFMFYLDDVGMRVNRIFIFFLIVMGNLFLTNLLVALVALRFNKHRQKELDKIRKEREDAKEEYKQRQLKLKRSQRRDADGLAEDEQSDNEGEEGASGDGGPDAKKDIVLTRAVLRARRIVNDLRFQTFIMLSTITNVVLLAMNSYEVSNVKKDGIFVTHLIMTGIFTIECGLRWRAFGWKKWLGSGFNFMEFVLTVFMYVEIITKYNDPGSVSIFGALCALRLLRIIDFMHTWQPVQLVFTAVLASARDIFPVMLFVIFYMYVFAVIGMQQLGGFFSEANKEFLFPIVAPEKRWPTFDNFLWSCLSVFQIMTGENWFKMMYIAIHHTGWAQALLFVLIYVIGAILMVALMIAVMLGNFTFIQADLLKKAQSSKEGDVTDVTGFPALLAAIKRFFMDSWCLRKRLAATVEVQEPVGVEAFKPNRAHNDELRKDVQQDASNFVFQFVAVHQLGHQDDEETVRAQRTADENAKLEQMLTDYDRIDLHGASCCCLWPTHRLRRRIAWVLYHRWYWIFSTFFALVGIVILAVREPSALPGSQRKLVMDAGDIMMMGLFLLEFLLQWIALGLWGHPGSYFSDKWNWINFVIMVTHVAQFIVNIASNDNQLWRIFQSLLALRALRLLIAFKPTRRVLMAVFATLPSFLKVLFLGFCVYIIFAIFGIALFKGKLRRCTRFDGLVEYFLSQDECVNRGVGVWDNPSQANFDDIWGALRTLYSVGTTDGWTEVMFLTMDATPASDAPMVNYDPSVAVYFFIFVLLAAFFIVTLFIALVVFTFMQMFAKRKIDTVKEVTKLWMETYAEILTLAPKRRNLDMVHQNQLRSFSYFLVASNYYEIGLWLLIALHSLFILLAHPTTNTNFVTAMNSINGILLWATVIEVLFRSWALNFKRFWADPWARADVVCLAIALLGFFMEYAGFKDGFNPEVLRVFSILRLARLNRIYKPLNPVVRTIAASLMSLLYITIVLAVVLIMYAYIGMILFGRVKHQDYITEKANFETFGNALMLVCILATGVDWTHVMQDARIQPPNCVYSPDHYNECGWPTLSLFYFISLSMVTTFLLLNLFVAVLLNSFKSTADIIPPPITVNEIRELVAMWSADSVAKQGWLAMEPNEFIMYVETLPAPFGLDRKGLNPVLAPEDNEIYTYIADCAVPLRHWTVMDMQNLQLIEGAVRLEHMPKVSKPLVNVTFDDENENNMSDSDMRPETGLYIHFVDAMLGISAMRFRRAFGANFSPGAIPRGDKQWKMLQQKYTYRFQLTHDTVAMPLLGLLAIRVIWGHWQLMKQYYFNVKRERELVKQRERYNSSALALQLMEQGYTPASPTAGTPTGVSENEKKKDKEEGSGRSVDEVLVVEQEEDEEEDWDEDDDTSDEEEEDEGEKPLLPVSTTPSVAVPNADPTEVLRELVLAAVDDPQARTQIRLQALQQQQAAVQAAFMSQYQQYAPHSFASVAAVSGRGAGAKNNTATPAATAGGSDGATTNTNTNTVAASASGTVGSGSGGAAGDSMNELYSSLAVAFQNTLTALDHGATGQKVRARTKKSGNSGGGGSGGGGDGSSANASGASTRNIRNTPTNTSTTSTPNTGAITGMGTPIMTSTRARPASQQKRAGTAITDSPQPLTLDMFPARATNTTPAAADTSTVSTSTPTLAPKAPKAASTTTATGRTAGSPVVGSGGRKGVGSKDAEEVDEAAPRRKRAQKKVEEEEDYDYYAQ